MTDVFTTHHCGNQEIHQVHYWGDVGKQPKICTGVFERPPVLEEHLKLTREDLIQLCKDGIVPVDKWRNRDTPQSQEKLYLALGLLSAGCEYRLDTYFYRENYGADYDTIWISIEWPSFDTFENGDNGVPNETHFYIPTRERLEKSKGGDWY